MPLSPRERRAIWHARQHYLKEFLFLLGPSPDEVETPAAFLNAFRYALSSINERITAEDPLTYDAIPDAKEPAPCPAFPTTSLPGLPSSSLSETLGPEKLAP